MRASGLASSMPLMNRLRKPRTRRPMRANMRSLRSLKGAKSIPADRSLPGNRRRQPSDEAPQLGEPRLDLLRRQVAEPRRQEALVGALLDRDEVHVFELARVRARPHLARARRPGCRAAAGFGSGASSQTRSARTSTPSISLLPRPCDRIERRQVGVRRAGTSACGRWPGTAPASPRASPARRAGRGRRGGPGASGRPRGGRAVTWRRPRESDRGCACPTSPSRASRRRGRRGPRPCRRPRACRRPGRLRRRRPAPVR